MKKQILNKNPPLSPFLLPKSLSIIFLILLFLIWVNFTSRYEKLRSLIVSLCYSLIETMFYGMTVELENGDTVFRPFDKNCRKPHTTFTQFIANIFYLPFGLTLFYNFIPNIWMRLLFFPFKIWMIEIIEGYAIMAIFGKNIAWFYYSDDAMFHGNIRLRYFKYWLLMGILSEILYNNFLIKILP